MSEPREEGLETAEGEGTDAASHALTHPTRLTHTEQKTKEIKFFWRSSGSKVKAEYFVSNMARYVLAYPTGEF